MADHYATDDAVITTEPDPSRDELCGFLGESDAPGYHRLFTDPTFKRWVDIRDDDILDWCAIAGEQETFGERSVVSVSSGALLVKGEMTVTGAEADFLSGSWSAETPWEPGGEGVDCATPAPRNVLRMASPDSSPSGPGCCHS